MSKLYQDVSSNKGTLLNVQESAQFLAVGVSTIRRWAQQKKLHGFKVGTRGDWRFRKEDLLKMVRSNSTNK